jgi:hypothetical protein
LAFRLVVLLVQGAGWRWVSRTEDFGQSHRQRGSNKRLQWQR